MSSQDAEFDESFAGLVAENHVQLRSFVRMLGVDPEWVDDLAQETFLVALRERESFDEQQDVGKWLRGIARNLVRNEIRKGARRQRLQHVVLADMLLRSSEADDDCPEWSSTRLAHLRDCVEQLPPKSRQIVSGRYSDGWKAPDLAAHLEMSVDAVRQALVRIRQQLKTCIERRITESI
ncbi:sigma-70 family RNA polymerase sigma factor [Blastopirellula sp. J2-11]|uniref:sigma-70 family RNA polymerase sigma factor n=1 Tax=Blastopirellula sp. J2-11 TaxID=2943192 RepID=UPI0021C7397F|nr:sigma-70 family RNA polymerase sigma factor [Blastopirellula sp. J2-11]UUO08999.1 sigma-70 family RNA polymerase sigma factor [Blastopirellula sp. J2-11]